MINNTVGRIIIMKKMIIFGLMVTISFALFACAKASDKNSIRKSSPEDAVNSLSKKIINCQADWPYYETIAQLTEACDHIFIGKVEKVLPAIRINESTNSEHEVWNNYTPSKILIEKVFMGNKTKGETVFVVQDGGTYTGITENSKVETIVVTMEDVVLMKEGSECLLFVMGEENVGKGKEYSYFLPNPQIGYCNIVDGKLVPNENNNLFKSGTSLDEAITMIEKCLNAGVHISSID